MDGHVQKLVEKIQTQWCGRPKAAVDIMKNFRFLAVDVLSQLAIGKPFGCADADKDVHNFISIFNAGTRVQTSLSILPELKNLLIMFSHIPLLGGYLAPSPGDGSALGNKLNPSPIIQNVVRERFAKRGPKVEMLDMFIARGLTEKDAMEELLIIMSAGIETTTTAFEAILFLMLQTPGVLPKLQKEIDAVLASDSSYPIKASTIHKMSYLQACISGGFVSTHLRNHFIPGGTFVGINSKAAQLSRAFGDDVEKFRPDRWLEGDADVLAQMSRNLELVFNYGITKCLGMNIACMALDKVIFEVFRNFNVGLDERSRPVGVETVPRTLSLRVSPRTAENS
ncbi:Cytochrome P450 [Glarea lozoyensis ATCC 20868]|uniref:Cytochrome P450 n=1 Tax=Glarea lozoyensis (strain ATCC 20868 / MF5171) TaxID=1116229 RepID=S3CQS2_GLAL2|nr:Cytochrome P450 [Glarea lozoyensis ATCC 20868]EPE27469.1 Cytochrome P450 [Glarea lozoyensis ATCC 20868]